MCVCVTTYFNFFKKHFFISVGMHLLHMTDYAFSVDYSFQIFISRKLWHLNILLLILLTFVCNYLLLDKSLNIMQTSNTMYCMYFNDLYWFCSISVRLFHSLNFKVFIQYINLRQLFLELNRMLHRYFKISFSHSFLP